MKRQGSTEWGEPSWARCVLVALGLAMGMLVQAGCSRDSEARARHAAEKIKESIPDVEARALAQSVTEEDVTEAQKALQAASEYLGEINGKLDSVTINALQAFQRSRGIKDDGILNDRTKRELRALLAAR